jgi:DNA-binding response OmpR family regulator
VHVAVATACEHEHTGFALLQQLRQKIEANPERPQYVLTETGIGYRLRAPD